MGLWGFPSALGTSCHFPIPPPYAFVRKEDIVSLDTTSSRSSQMPGYAGPVTITVMEILPQAPNNQGTFVEQGQMGLFNL